MLLSRGVSNNLFKHLRFQLLSDMHMVAPTVDLAMLLANHSDMRVYQYHFTTQDSYHSVELNYIFGAPFSGLYADEMGAGEAKNFTEKDKDHSRFMMTLWTDFAKYGYVLASK